MSSLAEDVSNDISAANNARRMMDNALAAFGEAIQRKDWVAAEAAHQLVLDSAEAFLNHMAAGYKRME